MLIFRFYNMNVYISFVKNKFNYQVLYLHPNEYFDMKKRSHHCHERKICAHVVYLYSKYIFIRWKTIQLKTFILTLQCSVMHTISYVDFQWPVNCDNCDNMKSVTHLFKSIFNTQLNSKKRCKTDFTFLHQSRFTMYFKWWSNQI